MIRKDLALLQFLPCVYKKPIKHQGERHPCEMFTSALWIEAEAEAVIAGG